MKSREKLSGLITRCCFETGKSWNTEHTKLLAQVHVKQAVMPKYCRMCKLSTLIHLTILFYLHNHVTNNYLILMLLRESEFLAHKTYMPSKILFLVNRFKQNTRFALIIIFTCFSCVVFGIWLSIILLCSGDVHPNPDPSSTSSSESVSGLSTNMSTSIFSSLISGHNLKFVHYNIQSIASKLDLLHAELFNFDILAFFTETWLSASVDTDDLNSNGYRARNNSSNFTIMQ